MDFFDCSNAFDNFTIVELSNCGIEDVVDEGVYECFAEIKGFYKGDTFKGYI